MMFLSHVFWRSQACFCLLNTGQLALNCRFRQNDSFLVDVFNRSIPCCHASIQYNRSQVTSKYTVCGKQKKSGTRAAGELASHAGVFVRRDEIRAPLKTPAWKATVECVTLVGLV